MSGRHTPGPWVERDCEIQAADGSAICEMLARPEDEPKWGRDHADANSRLICAAPELLTALDSILHHAYDEDTPVEDIKADFDRMRDIAAKAINNATLEEA